MVPRKGRRGKVVVRHHEKGARVCVVEDDVVDIMGGWRRFHDVEDKVTSITGEGGAVMTEYACQGGATIGLRVVISLRDVLGYFILFKHLLEVQDLNPLIPLVWSFRASDDNCFLHSKNYYFLDFSHCLRNDHSKNNMRNSRNNSWGAEKKKKKPSYL